VQQEKGKGEKKSGERGEGGKARRSSPIPVAVPAIPIFVIRATQKGKKKQSGEEEKKREGEEGKERPHVGRSRVIDVTFFALSKINANRHARGVGGREGKEDFQEEEGKKEKVFAPLLFFCSCVPNKKRGGGEGRKKYEKKKKERRKEEETATAVLRRLLPFPKLLDTPETP